MSEAGVGSRPNREETAPRAPADPGGPTAPQGSGQGAKPPSWRALITGLPTPRSPISAEEECGIATIPPA
jgi:hypothetical protein